ncbi:MAG: hypothetical protein A7316_09000 [Candidatus Altiarchaeales archaeon WOR_SM1_86-2]|nr:MAG: hypothetical protein A7316_09000 [Candidatus Altiarchaeales archaeon WOR_SM1_86-2]
MPIVSETIYQQLEDRIDAEYYKPEYLASEKLLSEYKKIKCLGEIVHSFANGVEIRDFVDDGVPYIRVSDTNREFFVDISKTAFIRKNDADKVKKKVALEIGDILTNRSGTLGFSHIVTEEIKNSIISSHIIRLSDISNDINPYFIVAFLNSKYGRLQILRRNNGAVVPEINQPALKSVVVPIPPKPFQEKIEKLVKEAHAKRTLTNQKYKEAEELLYKELRIDKLELRQDKTFETTFSDVDKNMRFDSEYYQPKCNEVKSRLDELSNNYDVVELKKIANLTTGKQQETFKELTGGVPFYSIKDIEQSSFSNADFRYIKKDDHKRMKNSALRTNDVLLAITGATIGKTGIFLENAGNISGDLARIRMKEGVNPFYVLIYLESLFGQLQINQYIYGATNKHLSLKSVENIMVPIIPKPKQEEISNLIKDSFKLRKESKLLLDEAKQKVEDLIEKE